MHHDQPFFRREPFRDFVTGVLEAQGALTFVAGAGLTIPEGLPTWRSLVWQLLRDRYIDQAATRDGSTYDEAERYATALVKASDVISAATIASADLADDTLGGRIRSALYSPSGLTGPKELSTSQFARSLLAAAETSLFSERDVMILTTNYDDSLIKSETDHALTSARLRIVASDQQLEQLREDRGASEIPVVHLHGYIPFTGDFQGEIVLDERSYAAGSTESSWQAKLFYERLAIGPVIFIGMSMSDPNLMRYLLWAARDRADRFVLMSQEDFQWHRGGEDFAEQDLHRFDDAVGERFEALGLKLVLVDHYRQVPQALNELALAITADAMAGESYLEGDFSYGSRLEQWMNAMTWLSDHEATDAQWRHAQDILADGLGSVRAQLAAELKVSEDDLRVDLWLRSERELLRVGSSDVQWTSLSAVKRASIDHQAPGLAVMKAFCNGVGLRSSSETSRWRSGLSLPITLSDTPEFDLLPVGVLDIRSKVESVSSPLGSLTVDKGEKARAEAIRVAVDLASPDRYAEPPLNS